MFYFVFNYVFNAGDVTLTKSEREGFPLREILIMASYLVKDASAVTVGSISLEFCMAQAPCQVKGLITTVIFLTGGIFYFLYVGVDYYIYIKWVLHIVRCVVLLAFFVMFVFVSKWYKLRKRDDVIPYHMFAEDQFESNYRQECDWLKDHGYFDSSDSNTESH